MIDLIDDLEAGELSIEFEGCEPQELLEWAIERFSPRIAQEAIEMQTVVSLVSSGLGVALVPASVARLGREGVVYREIADPHPPLDVCLAWRRGQLGAAGQRLVSAAKRLARKDASPERRAGD